MFYIDFTSPDGKTYLIDLCSDMKNHLLLWIFIRIYPQPESTKRHRP